jgi:dUTP pyrophosphatase
MQVKILKHHPEAIIPNYATPGAAGLDLYARISHEIYLQPGVRFTCPVGVGIELPEGFEAQIRGRSGLAQKHGIGIVQGVGTVDADFRGEIKVLLINHGEQAVKIEPNQRIAQMVIAPVTKAVLVESECLGETERGAGGFGSTDKKAA